MNDEYSNLHVIMKQCCTIDLNLDLNAMVMTSDLTRAAMVGDGGLLEQGDVGDVRQPSVDGLVSPSDANALIVLKQGA